MDATWSMSLQKSLFQLVDSKFSSQDITSVSIYFDLVFCFFFFLEGWVEGVGLLIIWEVLNGTVSLSLFLWEQSLLDLWHVSQLLKLPNNFFLILCTKLYQTMEACLVYLLPIVGGTNALSHLTILRLTKDHYKNWKYGSSQLLLNFIFWYIFFTIFKLCDREFFTLFPCVNFISL